MASTDGHTAESPSSGQEDSATHVHNSTTNVDALEKESSSQSTSVEAPPAPYPTADFYQLLRDTEQSGGVKPRRLPFLANQLSVHAAAGRGADDEEEQGKEAADNSHVHRPEIRTLLDALFDVIRTPAQTVSRLLASKNASVRPILQNINVSVQPGEMLLVLGRPGSGCSTFLKAFSNQLSLSPVQRFSSELHLAPETATFGSLSSSEFQKRYPFQAVYLAEDDFHYALLTVSKTLDYANEFSVPNVRGGSGDSDDESSEAKLEEGKATESAHKLLTPGPSRRAYIDSMVQGLMGQFGIAHVAHSIVGDAFVRGVSGGERKRVSIAEILATRATFLALDQATKGLDANTALDFAQNLRQVADKLQATVAVSIYQASDTIYENFDKVLVLDHGRQVYFGPASTARQYFIDLGFEDLPRNSTADYLVNVTDRTTRTVQKGRSAHEVPQTPADLEQAYYMSKTWEGESKLIGERQAQAAADSSAADFKDSVGSSRGSARSVYTVPFHQQLKTLIRRQLQLQLYNAFGIIISLFTAVIIAVLIGTVYYKSPATPIGAQSKAGLLFTMLLFITLNAFNELPMQMLGRPLMFKQMDYGFYRASALSLAGLVADIPVTFAIDAIFSIMIYFMGGLDYNGGAFWTFFAIIYVYHLASMSMFRTVGAVCPNFDVTSRLATLFIPNMVLYSGYFLQQPNMRRWSFWISYVFPLRYAFDGLLSNEFYRTSFTCDTVNTVPSGPGYPDFGPNQVCNIQGAVAGEREVTGQRYIDALYGVSSNVAWRNFGLLVIYLVGCQLIQMVIVENVRVGGILTTRLLYKKENAERKKLNEALKVSADESDRQKLAHEEEEAEDDVDENRRITAHKWPLTFRDLTYEVGSGDKKINLLDSINGYVKPGSLTALMGVSGAGKTTLLDVLSKRKVGLGVVGGEMLLGGQVPSLSFQRGTAYVEQQDIHEHTATVREAFRFSAYLRQPHEVSVEDKNAYVEYIIDLLELRELADAQIGAPGTGVGLSAEARKRVTMGVELSAKPHLLVFLDEPTSGQDGQSAYNTVRFLKKLAARGQAVLCTIHQPNALLFESFDRALILAKGGKCVYFGDLGGRGAPELVRYFESNGANKLPDKANPAEWALEQIGEGARSTPRDWPGIWKASPEHAAVIATVDELNRDSLARRDSREDEEHVTEYATPLFYQLRTVTHRMFISSWRSPDYGWTRAVATTALAAFTAICFWQLGNGVLDMRARIFAIFMIVVLIPIAMVQIEPAYNLARDVYHRETSAKMYDGMAFGFAVVVAELPFSFLCAVLFFVTLFYPVHFNYDSNHMGYQFLMTLLGQLFATTLGQAVSAITPNMFFATLFNPLFTFIFLLFCGVTIPYAALPAGWRYWMYYLNPATYIIGGMTVTELHDLPVTCKSSELLRFPPPGTQSCADYAGAFVERAGGYLVNNGTALVDGMCEWCQYKNGPEYYTPLNLDYGNKWRDVGIVILFIASNLFVVFLGVRFLNFNKR